MTPARLARAAGVACLSASLTACVSQTAIDRDIESRLEPLSSSCLAAGYPAKTPQHTDCVLALYAARQQEMERLRNALEPPAPPPTPGAQMD